MTRTYTLLLPTLAAMMMTAGCSSSTDPTSEEPLAGVPKVEDKIVTDSGYGDKTPAQRRDEWLKGTNQGESWTSDPAPADSSK